MPAAPVVRSQPHPVVVASAAETSPTPPTLPTVDRNTSAQAATKTPTQADVNRVVSTIPIRFYQASRCPHCRRAKAWFASQNLNVIEYDVDHDALAKQEMENLNASGGIPTIVVAKRVLVGFDEAELMRALASEASQRLGTTVQLRALH